MPMSRRSRSSRPFSAAHALVANHGFDYSPPRAPNNNAATGSHVGPPAPPWDGLRQIGYPLERFEFRAAGVAPRSL